jgi:hypothetical protein
MISKFPGSLNARKLQIDDSTTIPDSTKRAKLYLRERGRRNRMKAEKSKRINIGALIYKLIISNGAKIKFLE